MEWDRIVNLASNFVAGEMRFQFIPRLRPDDELMIDVMIAGALSIWLSWKNDGIRQIAPGKFLAIKISRRATSGRPSGQVWQFHLQDRRLQFIKAKIPADE